MIRYICMYNVYCLYNIYIYVCIMYICILYIISTIQSPFLTHASPHYSAMPRCVAALAAVGRTSVEAPRPENDLWPSEVVAQIGLEKMFVIF